MRFAHALEIFQEEARRAFADAHGFEARKYDDGLSLGEIVRQHRQVLGLSLSEFAEMAGLSKAHVWAIEDGRTRNPTVKIVAGLAGALGLSLSLVFYAALRSAERDSGEK